MKLIASVLAVLLAAEPAVARDVIAAEWKSFHMQVSQMGLAERKVRIELRNGRSVRTRLYEVREKGLLVGTNRGTKEWEKEFGRTLIPRQEIRRVQFSGRIGNGKLGGALLGLAAGAAVGAATMSQVDCWEGACLVLLPLAGAGMAGVGALAGYLIGRSVGEEAPEFVIVP